MHAHAHAQSFDALIRVPLAAALSLAALGPAQAAEPGAAAADRAIANPFAALATGPVPAAGSVLTAPVTLNANTAVTTDAFTSTQTGAGRAITGVINKPSNTVSAVKGITNGSGSGVNGVNTGSSGPAGKFQITNAASVQPSLIATTTGTGNAVIGVMGTTANDNTAAVLGAHNATAGFGTGVEGRGGRAGVAGSAPFAGVSGIAYGGAGPDFMGVWGQAYYSATGATPYGVRGDSDVGFGLYGQSGSGDGAFGQSDTGSGVRGISGSGSAVVGYSATGSGVAGYSDRGYAGYFGGPVYVSSTLSAQSYVTTSDRNAKQGFEPIDNATVLDKIAALPITSWDYKDKPSIRHIGPMAQDFRAAFGLGVDDTHIDLVDSAGVSLAAIQALQRQLKEKDARIAALEARATRAESATATLEALGARLATLEQAQAETRATVSAVLATQP